jgi:mannan endo-1,4-beta-mannosidase
MPLIQKIADERAMWSYIGQWGGNFIVDDEGKLSEEHNTEADIITMYNNNLTVTRDKLPDFISLASEIKQAEEKAEAEMAAATAKSDTSEE